jgi:hypothetical protein
LAGWIALVGAPPRPLWAFPFAVGDVVELATRSGMSDRPLGDPRPVAVFALSPLEPDPKKNHNQDESPPARENGLTLWKSLEGSA